MGASATNTYTRIILTRCFLLGNGKEEHADYIKREQTKNSVERVSYAKVWGKTAKDKSTYLSDLHTEYYNEVGYKYGLQRGIPYDELSPEERRGRRHKDKVIL